MAFGPAAGIVYFNIGGLQYKVRGELKVQPNMTQNDWIANQDTSIDYTQKPVVPFIELKIGDSGGLSLQAIQAMNGEPVTAKFINGKTYTLQNAAPWGETTVDSVNGEVPLKLGGTGCYENLAA